jgi:hypothetical protein
VQAVRNGEHRGVLKLLPNAQLHCGIGGIVNGSGGFVEDEHFGFAQQGTANAQELPLPDAEVLAPFGNHLVELSFESAHGWTQLHL